MLNKYIANEQFKRDFLAYEELIIQEFGHTSYEEIGTLHQRLAAARDFYLHIREVYKDGQE